MQTYEVDFEVVKTVTLAVEAEDSDGALEVASELLALASDELVTSLEVRDSSGKVVHSDSE